jgi:hypothetical protein
VPGYLRLAARPPKNTPRRAGRSSRRRRVTLVTAGCRVRCGEPGSASSGPRHALSTEYRPLSR